MLKRFEVCNYRIFKNTVVLDFSNVGGYKFNSDCTHEGLLSKIILYGRNATGKTSLGRALQDLFMEIIAGRNLSYCDDTYVLNADSDARKALFRYEFVFDGQNLIYSYEKDASNTLQREKIYVNDKLVVDMDFTKGVLAEIDINALEVEGLQVNRYLETIVSDKEGVALEERHNMSFLRFLFNNAALTPDSLIYKLRDFISKMRFSSTNRVNMPFTVISRLTDELSDRTRLDSFERFLNEMGIECKLCLRDLPDGRKDLCFKHHKLVPFYDNASSGTKKLTKLYFSFFAGMRNSSFIFMDEFDAFFHYEMAEKVVLYLKKYHPKTQVILTTHNTNLMNNHIMRPDCLMILSRDGRLTALCDATERELREGHNLEKMYIAGEFERYE